jgi:hypothetical protein
LPEICSLGQIVTTIANPKELKLGQEVLRGDLQTSHSGIADMKKLNPKIEEVIEFQR